MSYNSAVSSGAIGPPVGRKMGILHIFHMECLVKQMANGDSLDTLKSHDEWQSNTATRGPGSNLHVALYPGLLIPAFVAYSTASNKRRGEKPGCEARSH